MTLDQPNVDVRAHVPEVAVVDDADTPCPGEVDPVRRIAAREVAGLEFARAHLRASGGGGCGRRHVSAASHSASKCLIVTDQAETRALEGISASKHAESQLGGMFWLRRKKLSGSYLRFSARNRSYLLVP